MVEGTVVMASTNRAELQVEVAGISEHRGSESRCNLMLKFTGDMLASKQSVFKVRAIKAIDDTGSDLVPKHWKRCVLKSKQSRFHNRMKPPF